MGLLRLLFSFQGRINRARYWLGVLLELVVFILGIAVLHGIGALAGVEDMEDSTILMTLVYGLIALDLYISFAIHAKRFHDRNSSGWWQLVSLIPFGGIYVLVVCGFLPGDVGPNSYGPDPLLEKTAGFEPSQPAGLGPGAPTRFN